jgi:hypothetical protein
VTVPEIGFEKTDPGQQRLAGQASQKGWSTRMGFCFEECRSTGMTGVVPAAYRAYRMDLSKDSVAAASQAMSFSQELETEPLPENSPEVMLRTMQAAHRLLRAAREILLPSQDFR